MSDEAALERAVRRFPHRLQRWRRHGLTSAELHDLTPQILAEYRRIVAKEITPRPAHDQAG